MARARLALGASQESLADAFGVSRALWSQYERGLAAVEAGDMQFLAEILRVPINYFYEPGDVAAQVELTQSPTLAVNGHASNVGQVYGKTSSHHSNGRSDIVITTEDGLTEFHLEIKLVQTNNMPQHPKTGNAVEEEIALRLKDFSQGSLLKGRGEKVPKKVPKMSEVRSGKRCGERWGLKYSPASHGIKL